MAKRILPTLSSVYRFKSARAYVAHYFGYRKRVDSSFGYQLFANECGLKSVSYLQMVIAGNRVLSLSCVHRIAAMAKMTFREHEYLEILALLDGTATKSERSYYLRRLRKFNERPEGESLQMKKLPSARRDKEWEMMPLLAMLAGSAEGYDAKQLAHSFGLSEPEVLQQVHAFVESEVIIQQNEKFKINWNSVYFHDGKDFSGLQKKILSQFLSFSNLAMEKCYDTSKFVSHTLTGDPSRISEFNEEIRSFLARLTEISASHDVQDLLQLNLQCFDLKVASLGS